MMSATREVGWLNRICQIHVYIELEGYFQYARFLICRISVVIPELIPLNFHYRPHRRFKSLTSYLNLIWLVRSTITKICPHNPGAEAMSVFLFGRQRNKGEILKAERMLVRIERIDDPNQTIPEDYNEETTIKTRLKRLWREYYVVARAGQSDSKHIVLHIHKSRVFTPPIICILKCSEFRRRHIRIPGNHHVGKYI
jgi:hypothetical protein